MKSVLFLPTTFPAGQYSQTTNQPLARRTWSGESLDGYPQSTAAQPTSVVDLQTSWVKWPVCSVKPVGG